ncbi:MAG: hypothetical protein V7749_00835 [Cocleimonas sp.]
MNKTILVKAFFKEELDHLDPETTQKKSCWASSSKTTKVKSEQKHVDKIIDSERLALDLETAINKLYGDGYQLKEVVTITSGSYGYKFKEDAVTSYARSFTGTEAVDGGASYGYGYGFSYTDSLIVIGCKVVTP